MLGDRVPRRRTQPTSDNLDAAPDVCGDITGPRTANNPLFVKATITALCPSTPGEQLQLPFATTWRQPGSNEVCGGTGNGTATQRCLPGGAVEVQRRNPGPSTSLGEPTSIVVTKDAMTPSVPETGGSATYSVTVKNTAATCP